MFSRSEEFRDVELCVVDVVLVNSRRYSGVVERPRTKSLTEFLNNGSLFIQVELFNGAVMNLCKNAIVFCELRDVSKAEQLALSLRRTDLYHPLNVLGLKGPSNKEVFRQAYLQKMRLYHADRYANMELPTEVTCYLSEMAKRINAAYKDALAIANMEKADADLSGKRSAA